MASKLYRCYILKLNTAIKLNNVIKPKNIDNTPIIIPITASAFPFSFLCVQFVRPMTDTIVPAIPTRPQKLRISEIQDTTKPTMHIVL